MQTTEVKFMVQLCMEQLVPGNQADRFRSSVWFGLDTRPIFAELFKVLGRYKWVEKIEQRRCS